VRGALANALLIEGRVDAAAAQYALVAPVVRAAYPAGHPQVGALELALAVLASKRGQLPEADAGLARAQALFIAAGVADNYWVPAARAARAEIALMRGDVGAAEVHLRHSLAHSARIFPAGHPRAAAAEVRLGHALFVAGRTDEAARHLRAGLTALVRETVPTHRVRLAAEADLAAIAAGPRAARAAPAR
jgi:ATP/maltotriose-dependent transcriptional regulator MalT